MNLGLNKLHGGALLTKMVNSSTVPVSVKERAEALKQMGVKEELERTKGIFKSWLDTVAKIRGSAELLQMQESNKSLQNIGANLKQGVVGLDSAAPLQSAIDMINSKLSHLAHLKQRIETLNNLGHNRNRLKRKRDKPNLALVDYNRYNSGYEVACREFIETEHELIGEYDFLIQEAKAGPGPCAKELAFLNHWCVKVFPLVCQNDIASVFQSLPNLGETSKAYEQRQSKFVQSAKLRGVQGTCGLTDTSTLTKAVSHQVGGSTKLEKKFAADFSTTTSAPAVLNEATVSADGEKSSPPPPPPPPAPSARSDSPPPSARSDSPPPPSARSDVPEPAPKAKSRTKEIPRHDSRGYKENEGKSSDKVPLPALPATNSMAGIPAEKKIEYLKRKEAGFLIAEKEFKRKDGVTEKWSEYIDRVSGDTYWLEASSCTVSTELPQAFLHE
jgi:hypothetical protein